MQRYDQNIEQATTKSLEALKAYSQGMTARRTQGDFDSVPFFRRAVELDPDFALAHARLGTVLSNLGETTKRRRRRRAPTSCATRSASASGSISRRATTRPSSANHRQGDRGVPAAARHLSRRLRRATRTSARSIATAAGSKEALQHLEEAVRLAPTQPLGHLNLGGAYIGRRRDSTDARREFEEVLKLQESMSARMRSSLSAL